MNADKTKETEGTRARCRYSASRDPIWSNVKLSLFSALYLSERGSLSRSTLKIARPKRERCSSKSGWHRPLACDGGLPARRCSSATSTPFDDWIFRGNSVGKLPSDTARLAVPPRFNIVPAKVL